MYILMPQLSLHIAVELEKLCFDILTIDSFNMLTKGLVVSYLDIIHMYSESASEL